VVGPAHRQIVELKEKVTQQIVNLFKGETDLRKCWKILDELGLVKHDFEEADFQDSFQIIDAVVDEFVVQEDAELSEEGFLKAQSDDLNQKYKDVRKALSIKAMHETLEFSCSPGYLKGAHSYVHHPFSACISLQGTHALLSRGCVRRPYPIFRRPYPIFRRSYPIFRRSNQSFRRLCT
jgi:hypothetical protein